MSEPSVRVGAAPRQVTTDEVPSITINAAYCKRCFICIEVCPQDVYEPARDGLPLVVRPDVCIWCDRCENLCPDLAITLKGFKGW